MRKSVYAAAGAAAAVAAIVGLAGPAAAQTSHTATEIDGSARPNTPQRIPPPDGLQMTQEMPRAA